MSKNVQAYLAVAQKAKKHVSPLDAVMGEDWAQVELGNSMRLSLLGVMLKNQKKFGGSGPKSGRSPAIRLPLQVILRGNQAMVKVIRNGGTTSARGMRDQMKYLEKEGEATLERSERYFGTAINDTDQQALIKSWGIAGEAKTNSDKTTHFVVSFPIGTDHDAAYRAGRAWAEEMFAQGTYGDVYDYYTAFHTDRAHPHMHVVVNRRGLENGDWLKVSKRSQFNYDEFRAVQVEVAARVGIMLEATPRLARGVSDRTITDPEIRRAEREGKAPRAPEHTALTAIRAAASIAFFAEHMEADAKLIGREHPDLAGAMRDVALAIRQGHEINVQNNAEPTIDIEEAKQTSELIMSKRTDILDGIEKIDEELNDLPGGNERTKLEREASKIKASAAEFLPDVEKLRGYAADNSKGNYQGIVSDDEIGRDIKIKADEQVHRHAKSNGFDADKLIGRYQGDDAVSQSLAELWRDDELQDIRTSQKLGTDIPEAEADALALKTYDDVHLNARQIYRKAERDIKAQLQRRRELQHLESERTIQHGRSDDGLDF
ncbi:MAG: relaxase/mobilization nuclease domain-containing protein [Rhizobiaceae bacterium]